MAKKSNNIADLLHRQNQHRETLQKIVEEIKLEKDNILHRIDTEEKDDYGITFGQKAADGIAKFGGSWKFLILFFTFISSWIGYNLLAGKNSFDSFPFILLNLLLSCLASTQAPIILMSQNRREARDEKRARNDYLVDLQAELSNRSTERKLDIFLNSQFKELLEIQKIQIEKLDQLNKQIIKNNSSKAVKKDS